VGARVLKKLYSNPALMFHGGGFELEEAVQGKETLAPGDLGLPTLIVHRRVWGWGRKQQRGRTSQTSENFSRVDGFSGPYSDLLSRWG